MLFQGTQCDQCQKITKRWQEEIGWIIINSDSLIRVQAYYGIAPNTADPASGIHVVSNRLDFCSSVCLKVFVDNLLEQARDKRNDLPRAG